MPDPTPIAKALLPGASLSTASAVAGASAIVVVAVGVLALVLFYAWRVFENPDLFEKWLDLRDRRRHR
jgi:hypothetical protein